VLSYFNFFSHCFERWPMNNDLPADTPSFQHSLPGERAGNRNQVLVKKATFSSRLKVILSQWLSIYGLIKWNTYQEALCFLLHI
jgi:hypothetical protein